MARTSTFKGSDPMDRLESWKAHRHRRNNTLSIEACGYYFPGDGTLTFWYEKTTVVQSRDTVVVLEAARKHTKASR